MYLRLDDDELTVDDVFATFFAAEASIERVRAAEPLGHDAAAWERLAETGAPGMALPAAVGGGAAGLATVAIAADRLGRHLAPVPLIEHTVASRLIATLAPGHPSLEALAAGASIATLALNGPRLIPAGAVADVVVSRDERGIGVSTTNPPGAAVPNSPDLPLADRELTDVEIIGRDGWDRAIAEWQALMATALCGLGRRAVEIGVAYAKERHQFGVPVGSFQGVQHGFASAITGVEGATLLASRAIWALDTDAADALTLSAMAFLFSAEAAQAGAATSLQYHGGYGYAEEYDIQLYYRRAKGWALQYGDPSVEYQRLADLVLPAKAG